MINEQRGIFGQKQQFEFKEDTDTTFKRQCIWNEHVKTDVLYK